MMPRQRLDTHLKRHSDLYGTRDGISTRESCLGFDPAITSHFYVFEFVENGDQKMDDYMDDSDRHVKGKVQFIHELGDGTVEPYIQYAPLYSESLADGNSEDISTQQNPAGKLTEDPLIEILSRMPYKSLCRFKCVSRRWRSIISHPDHRKVLAQYHLQALAGFFYRSCNHDYYPSLLVRNFTAVSVGGRPHIQPSLPFLPKCEHFSILDSCNGLLLVCCYQSTDPASFNYIVCNPATEKWVVLPGWFSKTRTACLGFDPAITSHFYVFEFVEHGDIKMDDYMDDSDRHVKGKVQFIHELGDGTVEPYIQYAPLYSESLADGNSEDISTQQNPAGKLTEDPLIEILSRMPYKSLCRFKCVSRRWRSIISHPDHRKVLAQYHLQALAGFFYRSCNHDYYPSLLVRNFTAVSVGGRPHIQPSLPFLPKCEHFSILDSCNGLLLVCCYQSTDPASFNYIVCNPATEKWVVLPGWFSKTRTACLGFDPAITSHFYVFEFVEHGDIKMDDYMDDSDRHVKGKVQFIHELGDGTVEPYIQYAPLYSESLADGNSEDISTQQNPAGKLTEDPLIEILSRMPYKSLCRFKCVSRRWRSIISHPDHRKVLAQYHLQALAGFFYRSCNHDYYPSLLVRNFTAVSVGGRPHIQPSLPFLPKCEHFSILDSCNGLLLVCCYQSTDPASFNYIVCNPATEKWVVLPGWFSKTRTACLGFDPAITSHFYVFEFVEHGDLKMDDYMDDSDRHVKGKVQFIHELGDGTVEPYIQYAPLYSESLADGNSEDISTQQNPAGKLTEDPLIEILSRMPYKSLCRFKCVSRRWRSIISHPDHRKVLAQYHLQALAGFFYRSCNHDYYPSLLVRNFTAVSVGGRPHIQPSLPFLPKCEHFSILDSCNGLLLVCCYQSTDPASFNYIVCNPATEKWVVLPGWFSKTRTACLGFDPAITSHFYVFEFVEHGDLKMDDYMDDSDRHVKGKVQFIHELGDGTVEPYIQYAPLYSESLADGNSEDISTQQNPAGKLTEDPLIEILSRMPYKSLCRFKCVSRRWRSIISHPDHRKVLAQYHLQALAGFFYRSCNHDYYPSLLVRNFTAVSVGGRPHIQPSLPFLPKCEHFSILDSCNGLLLVCCYQSTDPASFNYIVCNPATEKWVVLPGWFSKTRTACLGFDPAITSHFYVFEFVEHGDIKMDDYMDDSDRHVKGKVQFIHELGDGTVEPYIQYAPLYSESLADGNSEDISTQQNPAGKLTEDPLIEILSRMPYKSLCRFKCVSRRWRSIISHPDHRKVLAQYHLQALAGFFYRSCNHDYYPSLLVRNFTAVSVGGRPHIQPSLPFLPKCEHFSILDSCNGLLLVCCYQSTDPASFNYIVCNPATEKWVVLPGWFSKTRTACLGFDPAITSHFYVFEFVEHGDLKMDDYMDDSDRHVKGKVQFIHELGDGTVEPYIQYAPLYSESLADGY
ncbi:hypothetical protein QYE76_067274 [Lolium multiflorum]|uniref:F-box domain-containing protein n=1 Tax=Lolium multiflorum TaxID=4521 RepID=A0AAD8SCI5_LOLMU|nr:hypothetical protein QYE76_067274 [Lolium multiflorum]